MRPGPPRRGAGDDNDFGAHGLQGGPSWGRWLQGAQQRTHGLVRRPIEMTLRNQHVKLEGLFLGEGGDYLNSIRKTVKISVNTFFFGDHIIFRTKLLHFLRLFWTSQNRKSVIIELIPDHVRPPAPLSASRLFLYFFFIKVRAENPISHK